MAEEENICQSDIKDKNKGIDEGRSYEKFVERGKPHRFDKISPEKLKELAIQGGKATKGIKKSYYALCLNCEAKETCPRAFEEMRKAHEKGKKYIGDKNVDVEYWLNFKSEWARCVYEIEGRADIKKGKLFNVRAFTSSDPTDLLAKMQVIFKKLEDCVDSDPTYTKLINMLYLMEKIYKMKFGEKMFSVSLKGDVSGNSSLDVKDLMKTIRDIEKSDKTVDVISKEKNEDDDDQGGDVP